MHERKYLFVHNIVSRKLVKTFPRLQMIKLNWTSVPKLEDPITSQSGAQALLPNENTNKQTNNQTDKGTENLARLMTSTTSTLRDEIKILTETKTFFLRLNLPKPNLKLFLRRSIFRNQNHDSSKNDKCRDRGFWTSLTIFWKGIQPRELLPTLDLDSLSQLLTATLRTSS